MPRLEKHLENKHFLNKVLTQSEQEIFSSIQTPKQKLEFLCGRFAAKEAYAKAKGTGIGEVSFLDFEVLRNEVGKPISNKGEVTISHDEDYAMAVVMVYG